MNRVYFEVPYFCNLRNEAKVRDVEASLELTTGKAKCTQSLLAKKNYSNMDYNANWQRFLSYFTTNVKIFRQSIVSMSRAEGLSVLFTFVLYW